MYSWLDWLALRANLKPGTFSVEVERDGQRRVLNFTLGRRHFTDAALSFGFSGIQYARLFLLVMAVVIVFARPFDPLARWGGLFLAILSSYDVAQPPGFAVLWRSLPVPLGALLWLPHLSSIFGGPVGMTFFASFPRRRFRSPWIWGLIWAPACLAAIPWALYHRQIVYRSEHTSGFMPVWILTAADSLLLVYAVVAVIVLAIQYRATEEVNDRRRVRAVFAGYLIAVVPQLPFMLITAVPNLRPWVASYSVLRNVGFAALPLSFAYAILRHRLFGIRVIIRRGLQYAFARRVLVSFVPLLAILTVADVWLHGSVLSRKSYPPTCRFMWPARLS